jgi:hypothetical protein
MTLSRILGKEKMFDHETLPSRFVANRCDRCVKAFPLPNQTDCIVTTNHSTAESSNLL